MDDMQFVGLLADKQKRAGYFITQTRDFLWLWHRRNGNPICVAIFLYENATVKEIREAAERDKYGTNRLGIPSSDST